MTRLLPQLTASLTRATETDDPVAAGRDALSQWGRYPWYDAETDQLQPIDLSPPRDWSWLTDWLNFSSRPLVGSWTWLQVLAWGLVAIVLVAVAWLLLRAYRRGTPESVSAEPAGERPEEEQRRLEALPDGARRRAGLREEARRCYEAGSYGEAMVYLFSHQLLCLDRNHLIRLSRGKTNRQYLGEVAGHTALHELLARTTVAFEDVFFGGRPIDRIRFESCWNQLDRFEALARREGLK